MIKDPSKTNETHRTTADQHNQEALYRTRGAHDPRETDEEDDAEDVLDAGQVDADERAHTGGRRRLGSIGVAAGRSGDGVGVVCKGAEESRRSWSVFDFFL